MSGLSFEKVEEEEIPESSFRRAGGKYAALIGSLLQLSEGECLKIECDKASDLYKSRVIVSKLNRTNAVRGAKMPVGLRLITTAQRSDGGAWVLWAKCVPDGKD